MMDLILYLSINKYLFYTSVAIISLIVGSFLNALIYRLPKMLEQMWRIESSEFLNIPIDNTTQINLFYPRSFCINCKSTIPFWCNIPLLSYILLLGNCHKCKAHISLIYPAVEFTTLILSLLVAIILGPSLTLIYALFFTWILLSLCVIDLQHQLLPDSLTLSLLWLGLLANINSYFTTLTDGVIGAILGYLSLWSFVKIFYIITGKVGMGHGDFKLFAALGAWFGWMFLPEILVISSLSGAIIGGIYLAFNKKSKNTPIPFGPFLCVAGFIILLLKICGFALSFP